MDKSTPAAAIRASKKTAPPAEAIEPDWQYIWESRFGLIVIEVLDDRIFVNGYPVDLIKDTESASCLAGLGVKRHANEDEPVRLAVSVCSEPL